jgi:hypothetical protein
VAASSSLGAVAVPSVVLVKGRRHYGGAGGGSHPMGAAVPGQFFSENCFAESYRCSQHTCAMNPGGGSR